MSESNVNKICSKCKIDKNISDFRYRKDKDYIVSYCRKCESKEVMETRNPENNKIRRAAHYKNNKKKESENNKIYISLNREKVRDKKREYYDNNKDQLIKYAKENTSKRIKNDPIFKLRHDLSARINYLLRINGSKLGKNGKSITKYLGYSMIELKNYLENQFEPWMSWKNHGVYRRNSWKDNDQSTWVWQIDHIIPQSTLPFTSMEDDNFKKCWGFVKFKTLIRKAKSP